VKRHQAMTLKAWNILCGAGPDAYARALAELRDDARTLWLACLKKRPEDGLSYAPTAEALKAWIDHHWQHWFDGPIAELEHRDAIKEQALGVAYAADDLEPRRGTRSISTASSNGPWPC
jgi:hypothetical protein